MPALQPEPATVLNPQHWVKAHADYLYAFARVRISDDELAKDLVQETFLAALQRVQGFEGKSSERTWLTAILKYKIIDTYRKKSAVVVSLAITDAERDQEGFFNPADGHWNSDHYPKLMGVEDSHPLENKEFNSILKQCMEKLPPLWMSVFTMKHIDDEASDTICAELKLSPNNFWVIIHRAKLNLRACLQKNWI